MTQTLAAPKADLIVPANIASLRPYIPGKPVEELQREMGLTDVLKLASNESPLGPSPKAMQAIHDHAGDVFYYPEGSAPVLREAVSKFLGVDPKLLVFGNGSDEILLLLTTTLIGSPDDEIVIGAPSFAMYEIYATMANAKLHKVPLDAGYKHDLAAMADKVNDKTKIIFIANPNNPTGTLVTQSEIDTLLSRIPDTVTVVLDEAYYEFVEPDVRPNSIPYVLEGRNVVVTRTFSKAYGLAGLRVGYAVASPELAGYMDRVRSPFNVNLIAQFAAAAALEDQEHIRASVELNHRGRIELENGARQLGLKFVPSQANFILMEVGGPDGRNGMSVYNDLLKRGVIVRPCAGFGLPNHIRVSIGTPAQMDRFLATLTEVLG